ncbi:hypothetical protein CR513_08787 [Mucuna pruriens]|uniref:Uncharacterized protein n=1 Tax=Mucuna pruriens TaxID=157652 RepID=A0A371HWF7_MUCPR|nr:hypothetical protein CR513_08787 [Mucuna pruriens]
MTDTKLLKEGITPFAAESWL